MSFGVLSQTPAILRVMHVTCSPFLSVPMGTRKEALQNPRTALEDKECVEDIPRKPYQPNKWNALSYVRKTCETGLRHLLAAGWRSPRGGFASRCLERFAASNHCMRDYKLCCDISESYPCFENTFLGNLQWTESRVFSGIPTFQVDRGEFTSDMPLQHSQSYLQ